MEELGILSQPFITSVDIMFLVAAGWDSKELQNFPPDMIRSLIQFELMKEENIKRFRYGLDHQKMGSFSAALQSYEHAMAA